MESWGGLLGEMVRTIAALALVCAIAYLVIRFGLKRWSAPGRNGPLQVLANVPLDSRRHLYLVEVQGRRFLVGSSDGGVTLLADLGRSVASAVDEIRA